MSESGKIFSENLKRLRGNKSQAEFSDMLGIVQQSYSRYERGSIPDGPVLLNIASKLKMTVDELLGHSVTKYPDLKCEVMELKDGPTDKFVAMLERKAERMQEELDEFRQMINEMKIKP